MMKSTFLAPEPARCAEHIEVHRQMASRQSTVFASADSSRHRPGVASDQAFSSALAVASAITRFTGTFERAASSTHASNSGLT